MKKLFTAVLLTAILSVALATPALAVSYPSPTSQFFVNDFAGVMNAQDKQDAYEIGATLQQKTGAQVVIVTIGSLQGMDDHEYALNLANRWGIGQKGKDNGVLLLLSKGDRKSRIEVGKGLEGVLNDAKTGRIQDDYILPEYKKNNYSGGLLAGYKVIVTQVYKEYGVTPPAGLKDYQLSGSDNGKGEDTVSVVFMVAILVIVILSRLGRRRGPRGPLGPGGGFFGGFFGGPFIGGGGNSGGGGGFGGGGSGRSF